MRVVGAADIGGTNTRIALFREDLHILMMEECKTPKSTNPHAISGLVIEVLKRISASIPDEQIEGIGVSVAGPVDQINGIISNPPNMPYDTVPITQPLNAAFNCPVLLLNDCRAAVLGEVTKGAGIGYSHIVYITISTGIGGGVYSDGHVLTGRGGNAGEIGHFLVDTIYMHPCSCDFHGHWEGYSSGKGMVTFFPTWCRAHNCCPKVMPGSAEEILTAAARGDETAEKFLQTIAEFNGRGLSSVIVAYDPEIIIMDGPVVTAYPNLILPAALAHTDRYLKLPQILISPLLGKAPLIGAAVRIIQSLDTSK